MRKPELIATSSLKLIAAVLAVGALSVACSKPPEAAKTAAASALPATPEEIARNWGSTPWKPVSPPGYFFSGFKDETEYGDPKAHIDAPNPAPLNPEWQARYDKIRQSAFDGANTYDQGADCNPFGIPYNIALNTFELLFTPGRMTILYDGQGGIRRVRLDGSPHPAEVLEPQYNGDSIAHWEGRTLVIDTVAIRADRYIEPGLPHSDQLHIVERWTQLSQDQIESQITMMDPVAFTGPWKSTRIYGRTKPEDRKYDFLDFTCENNRSPMINGRTVLLGPDGKPLTEDRK